MRSLQRHLNPFFFALCLPFLLSTLCNEMKDNITLHSCRSVLLAGRQKNIKKKHKSSTNVLFLKPPHPHALQSYTVQLPINSPCSGVLWVFIVQQASLR